MSDAIIRRLLTVQLNTVLSGSGITPIYENVNVTPAEGTAWVKADLLFARTDNPTQGDGFKRESGILQAMLGFPVGAGAGPAEALAEVIKAGFPRGLSLSQGTLKVWIDLSPYRGNGVTSGAWYRMPVSVPFVADVFG